jgi:hypothetical protein
VGLVTNLSGVEFDYFRMPDNAMTAAPASIIPKIVRFGVFAELVLADA